MVLSIPYCSFRQIAAMAIFVNVSELQICPFEEINKVY
jgi:hypothetical protein